MPAVATIDEERLESLAAGFSGVLLRPGDDGYDEARRIHNGLIDKRPALIARCLNTADIVDAVNLGREEGGHVRHSTRYGRIWRSAST